MRNIVLILLTSVLLVFSCDDDSTNNDNNTNNIQGCGNGIIEDGEVCDTDYLRGETCSSQGFIGGTLGCSDDCATFDTSGCNNDAVSGTAEPCSSSAECIGDSIECFDEISYGVPSGACMVPCTDTCEEEGFACVEFTSGESYCLPECELGGNDCRDGMGCFQIDDAVNVCWADCQSSEDCSVTGLCNTEDGFCMVPDEKCGDGTDNDMDGLIDCDDPDCTGDVDCGCTEDDLGNTTPESAVIIDVSSFPSTQICGYTCGPNWKDWYTFTPDTAFTGSINALFSNSGGDLDIFLYNAEMNELAYSWSTTDNEEIIYDFESGKTYFLEVQGYQNATNGYCLVMDIAPAILENSGIELSPVVVTPGSQISMNVTIRNIGGTDASGVVGEISTVDTDVIINTSSSDFGDITAGGQAINTTPFVFDIGENHKDNSPVLLNLAIADEDSNIWSFPVLIEVPYANITYNSLEITSDDNGNGVGDPGEEIELSFNAINSGALDASGEISVSLNVLSSSTAEGVTLTPPASSVCTPDGLMAGEFASCSPWGITIPSSTTAGEAINLEFTFTDGDGNQWTSERIITLGTNLLNLTPEGDAEGDHDTSIYECDLKELWALHMDGTLYFRTVFHSGCTIDGYHDVTLVDHVGGNMISIILEEGSISYYESENNVWTQVATPSSLVISPVSGLVDSIDFSIDISDTILDVDNSVMIMTAVSSTDPEDPYSDTIPDSDDNIVNFITFSW
ncbi:MAG: hypothetical protein JXR95_01435 [Deltaproteobacteria bacterium]|nr:hypothetical protein [Deltaproteobacteria bacterium]